MQDLKLEFQKREVVGKAVKRVRAQGLVPAVIHDHGKDSVIVQVDYQHMMKTYLAAGKHHPVMLEGARKYTALIKNITFDPKKNSITHVVFNAVDANEKVEAAIPIHAKFDEGNDSTPAERAGLIVLHNAETVEVEALPKDLPDALYFDGEKLGAAGDHATVADLIIPAGVIVKTDAAQMLASVIEPSALQAANDAAGGTADDAQADETTEAASETEAAATAESDAKKSEK